MRLKSIRLKNIRSYTDGKIAFPSGSLLIEGDIGSGKSTILLAIDFALFGTRPRELPASALLRKGETKGEVTLEFTLDGKDIEIRRVLEKKGSTIAQTAGYITINGTRKDLMSTGLKSVIFELLGYPETDIKAGKSLIYRYTVYTPQEQMKEIMFMKPDERLNTIRSIFNIDKYKRIRENSKNTSRDLRRKSSELKGIASGLDEKIARNQEIEKDHTSLESDLKNKEAVLEKIKSSLDEKKVMLEQVRQVEKQLNDLTRSLDLKKASIRTSEDSIKSHTEEIITLDKKIAAMRDAETLKKLEQELMKSISEKPAIEESKKKLEEEIRHIERNISAAVTRKSASLELIEKVGALDECPTCRQQVTGSHKSEISAKEKEKIENFTKIQSIHEKSLSEASAKKKDLDEKLRQVTESDRSLIMIRNEQRNLANFSEQKSSLEKKITALKDAAELAKKDINGIEKQVMPIKDIEEKSRSIEKELDVLNGEYMLAQTQIVKQNTMLQGMDAEKRLLEKEIIEKTKAKADEGRLTTVTCWLGEYFEPLMDTMEKHIMQSILMDFDSIFRQWFSMLIDDDTLQARIDSDFTPIIEQNSFETSYEFLSGGEKTSIALAYRLALNMVISRISDDIKTRGLIILDEPTDGFSSEQLDKVRDVLAELKAEQTIIVSHEEKIEGFVDRTVKVIKEDHKSRIVTV